jgi:hypothetical protein
MGGMWITPTTLWKGLPCIGAGPPASVGDA